jgi:hypothetical protein
MGYTWHGGELWKPPLGPVPVWAAPAAPAWTDAEVDAAVIAAAREGEKGYRGIFMGEPLWRAIFRAGLAAAAPAKEPRIVLCQECGWEVQLTEHAQCRNCGAIPQHPPQDAAPDVAEILLDLQEAEGYVSENPNVHSLARLCKRAHALLSSQQTRIAELERERDGFKAECDLNLHRVLTCGVAAEHPNADLTRTGAYAEKWNTKQAESVRSLRTRADKAEAECARMKPLFDKACAIVDAWDGQFKHPLKPLVDAARAALKGEA